MLTATPSGRLRQDSHMEAARASPEAGSPSGPGAPRRRDRALAPSECASASAQIRINRSSTVSSLRLTTSRPSDTWATR